MKQPMFTICFIVSEDSRRNEWLLSDDKSNVLALLTVNQAGTPKLVLPEEAGRQETIAGYDMSPAGTAPAGTGLKQR